METRKAKQNNSFSGARFKKNKQYIRFKYDQVQQIQIFGIYLSNCHIMLSNLLAFTSNPQSIECFQEHGLRKTSNIYVSNMTKYNKFKGIFDISRITGKME
jgi:hypothetical protein